VVALDDVMTMLLIVGPAPYTVHSVPDRIAAHPELAGCFRQLAADGCAACLLSHAVPSAA
jgi:hypothetical protein